MKAIIILSLLSCSVFAIDTVETYAKRIDAHLVIGDAHSALKEARMAIVQFPEDQLVHEMFLRALASYGDDALTMKEWSQIEKKFPELALKRSILEEICLGILKKGCLSDSIMTRLIGYLAIAQAKLPEAVDIIARGLNDSNAQLRALNVELVCHYRDAPLIEEIKRLFYQEQNVEVRISILKAIAKMKLHEMKNDLTKSLEKRPKMAVAEQKETIATLALLQEEISEDELKTLLNSGRSWQISLATAMMRKWQLSSEFLWPLVEKGTTDVKIEALKTLGYLGMGEISHLSQMAKDPNSSLGITASWALAFLDSTTLEENFSHWLHAEQSRDRSMAAAAMMMHGKKAVSLAKKVLEESKDSYVRANIALHLLKLRVDVESNAQILYDFLSETKEKLMWVEGNFPYIHRSTHVHSPLIANKPEAVNQSVRLEILNLLAIVEYQNAEVAIYAFLKEGRWEIAGLAAETLLQEGDESAIALVRGMLNDPDKHVQTQAALMLAAWGKDPAALSKLIELYDQADRTLKIKILESLGFLGCQESIPFLIERLKEPSGIFRMVAACVLLQTLYH